MIPDKRKGARASIKDILQKATEGVRRIRPQRLLNAGLETTLPAFLTESKNVIQLVNSWSKHQVPFRLKDLVVGLHGLNQIPNLSVLLNLIPTGASGVVQDSAFASSLLNIITKAARYHEAAKFLYRIAKKFPLVRNMEAQLASLPQHAYNRLYDPEYAPKVETLGSLLGLINGHRYEVPQIFRFMRFLPRNNYGARFIEQTRKTLRQGKIHSEIQLIAFCEIESSPRLFPRAIASSKDACFLCNAYIEKHGKMHTSRTHGRLYPGWRLPTLPEFKDLQRPFSQVLLNQARQTIGARAVGVGAIHPQPLYESTLLPISVSATTVSAPTVSASTVSAPTVFPPTVSVPIVSASTVSVSTVSASTVSTPTVSAPIVSASTVSTMTVDPAELVTSPLSTPSRQSIAAEEIITIAPELSADSLPTSHQLAPGESFTCCRNNRTAKCFTTGPLDVHVDMETIENSNSASNSPAYGIESLRPDEITQLLGQSLVIRASEVMNETQYELPVDNSFCMVFKDIVLRITSYPLIID